MSETADASQRNGISQTPALIALLPLIILFVAAAVLFWLTQKGMTGTYHYWEIFVPAVALISLVSGWGQAYVTGHSRLFYLIRQVLHWGALIGLLYVINSQGIRELMSDQQYTAIILYLLAFATLLAAIHMDLKLFFFSVFLVFCAYLIAVPADNPTLIAIGETFGIAEAQTKPLAMTIGVAGAGFVASLFIFFGMRGAMMSKRAEDKRRRRDDDED